MTIWALEWHDTKTQECQVCEIENGVCYEVFRTEHEASARATELNANAVQGGWPSRYEVVELPAGLKAYFD